MKNLFFPVAALAIVSFTSCLDSGVESSPRSAIMVNLLSPNATATNVYVNGTQLGSNVSYGNIAAGYNQVNAGNVTVQITNNTGTAQFLNATAALASGKYYSSFAIDSASRMKLITVPDSVSFPSTTDSIKVRFYNFAVNAPSVNVWVKDATAATWLNRGFESQTSASANNVFKPLKAGKYYFAIKDLGDQHTLKEDSITFTGGGVYTMFLKGFAADTAAATKFSLGAIAHQ